MAARLEQGANVLLGQPANRRALLFELAITGREPDIKPVPQTEAQQDKPGFQRSRACQRTDNFAPVQEVPYGRSWRNANARGSILTMNTMDALFESNVPGLELLGRGKVRDIYAVDDDHLLIVTSDRLSAYDVVMPNPIPGKGRVLTQISLFWFDMMADLVPNQLTSLTVDDVVNNAETAASLRDRSLVVKRLKPLPIEAVVRGYLIGSGWRDYLDTGATSGIDLPPGLEQAARLPETMFTPAHKAEAGEHDENISFDDVVGMIGDDLATRVRHLSIAIYERAAEYEALADPDAGS